MQSSIENTSKNKLTFPERYATMKMIQEVNNIVRSCGQWLKGYFGFLEPSQRSQAVFRVNAETSKDD